MKKFAVAFVSLHENNLTIEIVEAKTWFFAIAAHSSLKEIELPSEAPTWTLEYLKAWFFDADSLVDVKEIV